MGKEEFKEYLMKEYEAGNANVIIEQLVDNILNYAETMTEDDQYLFLCAMLPVVPESIIRKVYY